MNFTASLSDHEQQGLGDWIVAQVFPPEAQLSIRFRVVDSHSLLSVVSGQTFSAYGRSTLESGQKNLAQRCFLFLVSSSQQADGASEAGSLPAYEEDGDFALRSFHAGRGVDAAENAADSIAFHSVE